ncbi:MAG: 2-polyprenyl-6-methoxyphenol hydroxylase [Betaproteobacteria bacterium]|nr:2-polyprenyl-6-methoxyphenol hydroxylase [Betaproteobacteria bacterium]
MPKTPAPSGTTPRVLITGAGIGGLSAAASLLARGIDCEIYEQAPELKELGAGLWLSVNGARVLFALGLEPAIRASTIEADERAVRLWDSGRKWTLYKRGVSPGAHAPFIMLRAQLHRVLIDAVERLKPGVIQLNKRCTGFSQHEGKVRMEFADATSAEGDVLVGADGLHSKIREKAFGETPGRFTNALAWRGFVPMDRLKPHHQALTATTWVGPTAHVTAYPARWADQDLMTFSGQVERSDWRLESWSEKGSVAECVNDFAGWHPDVVEIIENTESLHKWGLFVRDPLPRWSLGRVTLLGDACHSMVPYLGQGVNMAIEDAGVLARCVEKYAADPATALQKYQDARLERTTKVAARSADMQHTFHNPALAEPESAAKYAETQWNPASAKARYDWIYQYDATQVPL